MTEHYNCLVVLGATASGKTQLACQLAYELNGAIISADSRQVYKHLDIGTGKDLGEYTVKGKAIPYYLIDLVTPGEQFYLHQFVLELQKAFEIIRANQQLPIICGGTGLYLDALQKDFSLTQVQENKELRAELELLSKEELVDRLKTFPESFIQHVDTNSRKRLLRGIEIAQHAVDKGLPQNNTRLPYRPYYLGISTDIETRRQRISARLKKRLEEGLVEEVQHLLASGITHERLEFLGLEYKFVSQYLQNKLTKETLFEHLQTAIFQYAKRQMTWFRKMEREGIQINWLENGVDLSLLSQQLREKLTL